LRLVSIRRPTRLLGPEHADLRRRIIAASDAAFGRDTEARWESKFTRRHLGSLARFYVLTERGDEVVGWSGYRAHTLAGVRVVYFASTGLLPRYQGRGAIPAVQRIALGQEARRHPLRPIAMAVRTRNPYSYRLMRRAFDEGPVIPALDGRVPEEHRALVAQIAAWLELSTLDPATAIVRDAYDSDGLYERDPRSGDQEVDELFDRLGPADAYLVLGLRRRRLTACKSAALRHER
jgi:hypothetical protein